MKQIYLPGLNALRAIAAIVVVVFHFSISFARPLQMESFAIYKSNVQAALAVTLFFVLSGYLITTLLIIEKQKHGYINIPSFYIRRILRIWPLYFLIIFLTFLLNIFLFNQNIFATNGGAPILYLLLLGNFIEPFWGLAGTPTLILAPLYVLWSVGVEEQFYLLWPWMLKISKKLLLVLTAFIGLYLALKLFVEFFLPSQYLTLFNLTRLDCMAIGAVGACLVNLRDDSAKYFLKTILYNRSTQIICWIGFISAFTFPFHVKSFIDHEIYSIFFIVVIINVSTNDNSIIKLENRVCNFLGQISYGIYMFHVLIMSILALFIKHLDDNIFNYLLWQLIVLALVFISSYLSNKYFESNFLKLKRKFEIVKSSNQSSNAKRTEVDAI